MKFIPYAKCKTPSAKARFWRNEMAYQAAILENLGRDPSHARDVASDLYAEARDTRRSILIRERDLQLRERA